MKIEHKHKHKHYYLLVFIVMNPSKSTYLSYSKPKTSSHQYMHQDHNSLFPFLLPFLPLVSHQLNHDEDDGFENKDL